MWNRLLIVPLSAVLMAAMLSGCGNGQDEADGQVELPAWLTEESAATAGVPDELMAPAAELGLTLNVGDQFPLRKVVEQDLNQETPSGTPRVSHSRLELMLAIAVKEKREGQTKLAVRYDRVKYEHRIADEHVSFDSTQPAADLPVMVRPYQAMIGDGFSFWIGADNQIVAVEGLAEFLDRCLKTVPYELRQDVVLGIEAGSGETGIANFVDNSIGLLPYGTKTAQGDSWERTRQISRPVPMHINNLYTLKNLTDEFAVIDIRGVIAPTTSINSVATRDGIEVRVDGGNTLGSCTIFRDTGLPKESRVDRTIEMTVTTPDATRFRQSKRTLTTIEAFPAAAASPMTIGVQPASPSGIVPASGTTAAPGAPGAAAALTVPELPGASVQ